MRNPGLAPTLGLLLACSMFAPVHAQTAYPQKPVKIVVPFAPGGASDILARALSQKLGESTGQAFVVENRPGAGGTLGAEIVAKSAPDGYTLLLSDVAVFTIAPRLYPKLGYATEQLAPVANVATFAHVLIAPPSTTLKTWLASEAEKWGKVVQVSGAKPD